MKLGQFGSSQLLLALSGNNRDVPFCLLKSVRAKSIPSQETFFTCAVKCNIRHESDTSLMGGGGGCSCSPGCCARRRLIYMSMNHSAPQSLIQRLIITPDFNRVLRQAYLLLPILHPKMRNKFRAVRVIRTLERQKKWKK